MLLRPSIRAKGGSKLSIAARLTTTPTNKLKGSQLKKKKTFGILPSFSMGKIPKIDVKEDNPLKPNTNTEDARIYTVTIKSNYGDPNFISIGSVWFLDSTKHIIRPIKVRSLHKSPVDIQSLSNIFLTKNNIDEAWHVDINEMDEQGIEIYFMFSEDSEPYYVRIWNGQNVNEASTKEIVIKDDFDQICFSGSIPMNFGIDAQLRTMEKLNIPKSNSIAQINELFNIKEDKQSEYREDIKDMYGYLPYNPSRNITLNILKNFGNEDIVTLFAIDIFDENYNKITPDNIKDVSIRSAVNFTSVSSIFRKNKFDYTPGSELFTISKIKKVEGDEEDINPSITISLKKPMFISAIDIWNDPNDTKEAGVSKASLVIDDNTVWVGRIRRKCSEAGITVYLQDDHSINKEIA